MNAEEYIQSLLDDTARFAAAVQRGSLDAPVAGCPGWDLRRLTVHQGVIHRWSRHCAAHAAAPDSTDQYEPSPDLDRQQLAEWLTTGGVALAETLRGIDLNGPTWHPFPAPKVASLWPRRQAHEVSVHRWDAERAVGTPGPIDPLLASDGIDEYLDLMLRRRAKRFADHPPPGSLHLHCTDVEGEWFVQLADGEYQLDRVHAKGDAALRGPAEALLLRLWHRDSDRLAELSPIGDQAVLTAWLD